MLILFFGALELGIVAIHALKAPVLAIASGQHVESGAVVAMKAG